MIGAARIRRVAAESGYREEIVEKVLYLEAILRQLVRHPDLEGAWALKGGTALNLFFLDVPRLSVDIDINYVGHGELEAMQAARPAFEAAIVACCEREGCSVRRMPAAEGPTPPRHVPLLHTDNGSVKHEGVENRIRYCPG